jgi:hypothetical protein
MKVLLLAMLVSMSAFSHADPAPGDTPAPAQKSCRKVITQQNKEGAVMCGTAEQWAELDRRVAAMNAGVTCRQPKTPNELCMNAEQWKQYDKQARDRLEAGRIGMEGTANAGTGVLYMNSPVVAGQVMQEARPPN